MGARTMPVDRGLYLTSDPADQYAWLDRHIKQQEDYWTSQGFPADIIAQVAEEIEKHGDDALEANLQER
jgi:hypothetical protein